MTLLFLLILVAASRPDALASAIDAPADPWRGLLRVELARGRSHQDPRWRYVRQLYELTGWVPLFVDEKGLAPRASALLRAVACADEHGLARGDYLSSELRRALDELHAAPPLAPPALTRAEIGLAWVYVAYGGDALHGQFRRRAAEPMWRIDERADELLAALVGALDAEDFDGALRELLPADPGYLALEHELARYRSFAEKGEWSEVRGAKRLRPGDRDAGVSVLRRRLRAEGYLAEGDGERDERDGEGDQAGGPVYDRSTALALAHFQLRHGLLPNGIVDAATRAALNVTAGARVREIEANLDRYRRFPRRLGGRHVVLNVSTGELAAYDHGDRVLATPAAVRPRCRTRAARDRMSGVIFHPKRRASRGAHAAPAVLEFVFEGSCIEVAGPMALAELVLGRQHWDHDAVARALDAGEEQRVEVHPAVPVVIANLTVYVIDGELAWSPLPTVARKTVPLPSSR